MLTTIESHTKRLGLICLLTASLGLLQPMPSSVRAEEPKNKRPSIYDTKADGEEQIATALAVAKSDHKRVLLQFGADWCVWCHRLHDLFDNNKDVAKKLQYEYELVLIDVDEVEGKPHNEAVQKRYGNPRKHGLPVLVVLDENGKQLTTKETESLEKGDGHDPAKVLAFLKKWQAKPVSADEVLSGAIAQAKSESKNVFVYYSAPWCGYCKKMARYLDDERVAPVFGRAFVPVKIDVERMTGGAALATRYGKTQDDGIPFFAVLDADGHKLADSRHEKSNVGFPVEPFEVAHFMDIIRKTGKKLTDQQFKILEKVLKP